MWSRARVSGTQIGNGYELRWHLDNDRLDLELVGKRKLTVELGEEDFFDLFASPFFNSLPVWQDGLLQTGAPRDYVMKLVHVPELTVTSASQRYTPKGEGVVGYSSGSFATDIHFDGDGFVTLYEGYLERVF